MRADPVPQPETHHVVEVTGETFAATVLASPVPVLVDVWGPRCIPCMELLPVVEDLATTYQGRLRVAKINLTQNRQLCADLDVTVIPAFLFFKNGQEVRRLGEETTADDLRAAVRQFIETGT